MIRIIQEKITKEELRKVASETFGDMVKAVVDVEKGLMAIGGELHADEEKILLEDGSKQEDLWGINIYLDRSENEQVEFNSMINIRPSAGNRSRGVENVETQEKIKAIVSSLML